MTRMIPKSELEHNDGSKHGLSDLDDLISLHIDESSRVNQSQIPRGLEAYAHQANTRFGHESSFDFTEWSF